MSELLFKVHFFPDLLFFPSGVDDEEIVISAKDYFLKIQVIQKGF